jgi:formate hydrogenlyase subunit 3/multisubunit Na+/H+ antiporter MnhD subunit
MGCLVALLAWLSPRFALALMWLFTDRLEVAFSSWIWGAIGFLVLPYTTVLYALAFHPTLGVTGFGLLLVGFGFLLDLGSLLNGRRQAGRR